MRTSARAPIVAPGNSAAPVATNASAPMRTPLTWACGPISTSCSITTGWAARPRTSACSITTTRSPSSTLPSSAVTTALKRIRASAPTRTSPHSTAVGATYADS